MNYFIFNPDSGDKVALQIKKDIEQQLHNQNVLYKTESDIGLFHFERSREQYILNYADIEKILKQKFDTFILCWSNETDKKFFSAMVTCALFWEQKGRKIFVFYEQNKNNCKISSATFEENSKIGSYTF